MRPRWWVVGITIAVCWALMASGDGWEVASQAVFSLGDVLGTPHSLSPDGELLLSVGNEAGICIYRAADLAPRGCYKPPEGAESQLWLRLHSVTWSPDGQRVLFSAADGRLWRIHVNTGKLEWLPASAPAEYVAPSPDGEYLAVGAGGTSWWPRRGR